MTAEERLKECHRAARRSTRALGREGDRVAAMTEALATSGLQRTRLEGEIQSHKDLATDKRPRFDRQQDELRTCTSKLAASDRRLAAARKETAQLRGAAGVDARLVTKDEPYARDAELTEDFTGEEWAALDGFPGGTRGRTMSMLSELLAHLCLGRRRKGGAKVLYLPARALRVAQTRGRSCPCGRPN